MTDFSHAQVRIIHITSTFKGTFKGTVEVVNKSTRDISGGITVSGDHDPENIFKSVYDINFPPGRWHQRHSHPSQVICLLGLNLK
jgi:hypothetical protein